MSRVQRTTLNYLANLTLTGLTIIVGFVLTPALLRALGEERFGATRAAQDWLGSLAVFDAAIFSALLPLLAKAYAVSDTERLQRIFGTALVSYSKLMLVMLLSGGVLIVVIPWLVPVDAESVVDLRLGCAVGLVSTLFVPIGILRGMIDARQRSYLLHVIAGLQSIAVSFLAVGFAWLDWGITGQFAAALAGQCLMTGMLISESWFNSRDLLRGVQWKADPEVAGELSKLNLYSFIAQVCGRISLMMDTAIIAALLEPALIVPFLMSQRLVAFVGGQLLGIGNAAWAAIAELHGKGEFDRLNHRMIELTRITVFLAVAALVPTAAYTRAFVTLWVGETRYAGPVVVTLASLNVTALAVLSLWGWAIVGTGQIRRMNFIQLPAMLCNLTISLIATRSLGVVGPLLGTFLTHVCVSGWAVPRVLNEQFGMPLGRLYGAVLVPLLCGLPFATLVAYVAEFYPPDNWLELMLHLAVSPWLYLGTAGWIVFSLDERHEWLGHLRRMIRKLLRLDR